MQLDMMGVTIVATVALARCEQGLGFFGAARIDAPLFEVGDQHCGVKSIGLKSSLCGHFPLLSQVNLPRFKAFPGYRTKKMNPLV
jgi:hypothetical protein